MKTSQLFKKLIKNHPESMIAKKYNNDKYQFFYFNDEEVDNLLIGGKLTALINYLENKDKLSEYEDNTYFYLKKIL